MKNQSGATLITILVLLLLITIIATLAIKKSQVSLGLATAAQAQQVMFQSSDAALKEFEVEYTRGSNRAQTSVFEVIKQNPSKEVVWCYDSSQNQFFSISRYSVIDNSNSNSMGVAGYCKADVYASGRNAVITQIAATTANPDSNSIILTQTSNANETSVRRIRVYVTSAIPALSSASTNDINDCFSKHMSAPATDDKSLDACLTEQNVPHYTAIAEYQDEN